MEDKPKYVSLRHFADDNELMAALQTGSLNDKWHALLNISYGDGNGEDVLDLFLNYINDPELKLTAYLCIGNFLEICRDYPLMKILPIIIAGLDNKEHYISAHCLRALECLVRSGIITDEAVSFSSFQIKFDHTLVPAYLNSMEAEKIIIGLLYIFHHPHKDEELFEILNQQLTKNIKSVNCIIGQIIDTKICSIIEQINGLKEISLASYKSAIEIDLGGKGAWAYDRFDVMQDLASQQMKTLKRERDAQNGG